jgi:F-type H+-transporting ATPase subunit b
VSLEIEVIMRRVSSLGWPLLASLLLLGGAIRSSAQEHKKGDHKESSSRYQVVIEKDHKEVSETLDVSKEADLAKLVGYLKNKEVEELAREKSVNLLALSWDLGLWTIVVFLLLFFILKNKAWGPMLEGLQKREDNILAALNEAKTAREEAQTLRTQLQKEMDNAAQKVAGILDEARRDAQKLKDDMVMAAKHEIATEHDRRRRELDMAHDQALQDLWKRSAELATLISVKTIRRNLTADDHRKLVDEALTELKNAGSQRQRELASVQ